MISSATGHSILSYLTARSAASTDSSTASSTGVSAGTQAQLSATALKTAGSSFKSATAGQALDKQQAALAADLRTAMTKAGISLSGAVEFSISADGNVALKGTDADKAATKSFLKADTTQPSFATRIASQAKDALKLSTTIQQSAAISQAARYAGGSGGVMSMYTSLMQQSNASSAVFSVSSNVSSLTYPGSLAAKA